MSTFCWCKCNIRVLFKYIINVTEDIIIVEMHQKLYDMQKN